MIKLGDRITVKPATFDVPGKDGKPKHEQSAPAGYRPRFAGTMKLYLVRHKEYGELTVNGVNKYEAVHAAARKWGVRWTAIARECEYIVLAEDTPEGGRP